ncbi:MAG: phage late control D family protein [Candidatus Aminicenantes bacterium]|nr:MAG: phage late control D family protein [Candidatus Aminicenantes bacterium]
MPKKIDTQYDAPAFKIEIEGKEMDAAAAMSIASVSVTKKMGQADYFSIQIQDEMRGGTLKWLGNKMFKYGNKVSIKMGYTNDTSFKMQGHIEEIKPQFIDSPAPVFEVAGKDKAFACLAEKSDYKCYNKKKDSDIVKTIASEVGLTPNVEATTGSPPEKKEKKGGTSYLQFIKKMVIENKEFEFFVSDGKLVFRKAKTKDSPVVELQWGIHLLSFIPRLNLSGILTGVTVRWWDEKKCEPIIGQAKTGDETPVGPGKTAGKIAKEVYGNVDKIITDQPADSKDEAKNMAIAVLNNTNAEFITGEGKTIGIPAITPGVVIELKDLGNWFSGKYYVTAVTQTIDSEGYYTTFNVRRNTI